MTPEDHAKAVLRLRDEARQFLATARASGDLKGARSCKADLREIDKLIVDYGLERFAKEARKEDTFRM